MSLVIAFGEGDHYFFQSDSQWAYNLPSYLGQFFTATDGSKVAHVHSLVLGANDSYYMSWRGHGGSNWQAHNNLPSPLETWLNAKARKGRHATVRLSLGPNNASYFVTDGSASQWFNLPSGLETSINALHKPGGGWTSTPRIVALGKNDSYVLVTEGNGGAWNVAAEYPGLDKVVGELVEGGQGGAFWPVSHIYLDAHDGGHYVLSTYGGGEGGSAYSVPQYMGEDIQAVVNSKRAARQQGTATAARGSGGARKSSGLGRLLLGAVVKGAVAGLAAGGNGGGYNGGGGGYVDTSYGGMSSNDFWAPIQQAAQMPIQ